MYHSKKTIGIGNGEIWSIHTTKTPDKIAPKQMQTLIYDQKTLLAPLNNKCLVYAPDPPSWWTFELCHRKEIRQFHLVSVRNAIPAEDNAQFSFKRDPDWSLGRFEHSEIIRSGGPSQIGNKSMPIELIIDRYVNGQKCDELRGAPISTRRTEVHLQCCPTLIDPASLAHSVDKISQDVRIISVVEVDVCQYRMVVCVPSLCSPVLPILTEEPSAYKVIQSLISKTRCYVYQEGWWTYELCVGTDLRQYHASTQLTPMPNNPQQAQLEVLTRVSCTYLNEVNFSYNIISHCVIR